MDKSNSSAPSTEPTTTPAPQRDRERPPPEEPRESPWWKVGASVAGASVAAVLRWLLEHALTHGRR